MKKKWCRHIHTNGINRYWMENPEAKSDNMVAERFWLDDDYKDWKFCPICATPRPKPTKRGKK